AGVLRVMPGPVGAAAGACWARAFAISKPAADKVMVKQIARTRDSFMRSIPFVINHRWDQADWSLSSTDTLLRAAPARNTLTETHVPALQNQIALPALPLQSCQRARAARYFSLPLRAGAAHCGRAHSTRATG